MLLPLGVLVLHLPGGFAQERPHPAGSIRDGHHDFDSGTAVSSFYDQEPYDGRMIWVRFVFTEVTANSHRDEQAFSNDGGKTWETNWINKSRRVSDGTAQQR